MDLVPGAFIIRTFTNCILIFLYAWTKTTIITINVMMILRLIKITNVKESPSAIPFEGQSVNDVQVNKNFHKIAS